jgi:hypothetical protein
VRTDVEDVLPVELAWRNVCNRSVVSDAGR